MTGSRVVSEDGALSFRLNERDFCVGLSNDVWVKYERVKSIPGAFDSGRQRASGDAFLTVQNAWRWVTACPNVSQGGNSSA